MDVSLYRPQDELEALQTTAYSYLDEDQLLLCPVCLDPFNEPVVLPCRHVCCKLCAKQLNCCPLDREPFNQVQDAPFLISELVSRLRICCGICQAVLPRGSWNDHYWKGCVHRCKATELGCKATFSRLEIETHQSQCLFLKPLLEENAQNTLLSSSKDCSIKAWNLKTSTCETMKGHTNFVYALACSDHHIASGADDKMIKIWDLHSKKCLLTLQAEDEVTALDLLGNRLFSVCWTGKSILNMWDLNTGKLIMNFGDHNAKHSEVWSLVHSEAVIYSGGLDQTIKAWDLETGTQLSTIACQNGIFSLSLSGTTLVAGDQTGEVTWFDTRTEKPIYCSNQTQGHGHTDFVRSVCISGDESTVISGSFDAKVKLWDMKTRTPRLVLNDHEDRVYSVATKGNKFASGSKDQTIRICDLKTGDCETVLNGHNEQVNFVAFCRK